MSKTLAKIIDQKTSSLRRRYSFCFCCVHDLESSSSLKVVQATGWTVNNAVFCFWLFGTHYAPKTATLNTHSVHTPWTVRFVLNWVVDSLLQ